MTPLNLRLGIGDRLTSESGCSFEVDGFVGAGGTAQVFSVRDEAGRRLAAKVLSGHRFDVDDEMRARFVREGRVLAAIEAPNIVRLVEVVRWNGEPVLLLEYADGGSVASVLDQLGATPPLVVSVRWLREALLGLADLHSREIVHRDISPKNLLIRDDGTVMVGDFGTVRRVDDETLTQDGARLGSLIYISRQQFEEPRTAAPFDDVYSLGQIAWQLLAGRRPIGNTPPLGTLCPDLSPGLVSFVERMRADDAGRRPADAGAALVALEELPDVLVKPALRRDPERRDAAGNPKHNPWSASVKAIEARQREELVALQRKQGFASVARAFAQLVGRLGPLHLRESPASDSSSRNHERDRFLPSWLSSGSIRIDVAAGNLQLLTLTNSITGLTLSYALGNPHAIQDVSWHTIFDELRVIEHWMPEDRSAVFQIFAAEQFTYGIPCRICEQANNSALRLLWESNRLSRAATCSHGGVAKDYMCCICGQHFVASEILHPFGNYDAVGCGCRTFAFEDPFYKAPWEIGVHLAGPDAVALFEKS